MIAPAELGWFVLQTAEEDSENPLLVVSMVEDVKYQGGSHYLISKVTKILNRGEWALENAKCH